MTAHRFGFFQRLQWFPLLLVAAPEIAYADSWTTLPPPPPSLTTTFTAGVGLQLTDGTILVQQAKTSNWWRLTPDINGAYETGQWAAAAPDPSGYGPTYFASAVLPDGRVIIEGGEYNIGESGQADTPLGAIYDPTIDLWTSVSAPPGWNHIGDASSVVLAGGDFMLANIKSRAYAVLDAATLMWTVYPGTGKNDTNAEEGWTLLPGNQVLTVDAYVYSAFYNPAGMLSEIFDRKTNTWSSAGNTPVQLWDSREDCGETGHKSEVGPAVLRPDGTVFATGADTCPGASGHTAIYDTVIQTWTAGPDIPGGNDAADAPASILPDGSVLVDTSPGYGKSPSTLYRFDGTEWVDTAQPTGLTGNSEGGRMLVMPNGNVLLLHVATPDMWLYQADGTYQPEWQPVITALPAMVTPGGTATLSGTQLNGLTQGAAFGDDAQSATNFPLVRITNVASNHVFYARTYGFSSMGVATGSQVVTTQFEASPYTETGPSTLVAVANGIPSDPVAIDVETDISHCFCGCQPIPPGQHICM